MSSLARWCFRRRFTVLGLWFAALVVVGGVSAASGSHYTDQFTLPGTESTRALELLQKSFKAQSGDTTQIVWQAKQGVKDPAVKDRITAMLGKLAKRPHIASVVSPYEKAGAAQISGDGTIAYATVNWDALPQDIPISQYKDVITLAQAAGTSGVKVQLGGSGIQQATQTPPGAGEAVGIIFAAIILFIAFGSLYAMLLPIFTAIFAIGVGLSVAGLLAGVINIATFAPTLATLIGLGVGIDYALFIVTRHRNAIIGGRTPEQAVELALNTSGRAVLFAGGTVSIALLGLLVLGVDFLNGVAIATVTVVLFTMLAATTLVPAFLGILKMRVLSRKERRVLATDGPHDTSAKGFWARWAAFVQRRPVPLALLATAAMVAIAIPFLGLRLGSSDAGSDPTSSTTRKAYDLLAAGFGPGFNGPLQLVAQTPGKSADKAVIDKLSAAAKTTPGVVEVSPAFSNPDGTVTIVNVTPKTAPQDKATSDLIKTLRNEIVPRATQGSEVTVYVGGLTAIFDDFAKVLTDKLPLFIGVIVLLGCLLLMLAFRSIVVPLVAAVMNLLAAGAAFGLVTAVFQHGFASSIIAIGRPGPVEAFLPVMLLAILFGLSMDYQVFLVSRMHEEWSHSHDNDVAVRVGQADTGRVITAAAGIMVLVFGSFLLQGQRVISEFGIGLAGAVLLDAFILRTVLVPALMHLIGPRNWWLPRGLDRVLPHVSVDPSEDEFRTQPASA